MDYSLKFSNWWRFRRKCGSDNVEFSSIIFIFKFRDRPSQWTHHWHLLIARWLIKRPLQAAATGEAVPMAPIHQVSRGAICRCHHSSVGCNRFPCIWHTIQLHSICLQCSASRSTTTAEHSFKTFLKCWRQPASQQYFSSLNEGKTVSLTLHERFSITSTKLPHEAENLSFLFADDQKIDTKGMQAWFIVSSELLHAARNFLLFRIKTIQESWKFLIFAISGKDTVEIDSPPLPSVRTSPKGPKFSRTFSQCWPHNQHKQNKIQNGQKSFFTKFWRANWDTRIYSIIVPGAPRRIWEAKLSVILSRFQLFLLWIKDRFYHTTGVSLRRKSHENLKNHGGRIFFSTLPFSSQRTHSSWDRELAASYHCRQLSRVVRPFEYPELLLIGLGFSSSSVCFQI